MIYAYTKRRIFHVNMVYKYIILLIKCQNESQNSVQLMTFYIFCNFLIKRLGKTSWVPLFLSVKSIGMWAKIQKYEKKVYAQCNIIRHSEHSYVVFRADAISNICEGS